VRWNGADWSDAGIVNNSPNENLTAVHCIQGGCWAVGNNGTALRLEAGLVWNPQPAGGGNLRGVWAE
jgi:hypothetical protein